MDEWTQFKPFTVMPEDVDWKMRVFFRTSDDEDDFRYHRSTMNFGASVDRYIDAPIFDVMDLWYMTTEPNDVGKYIWRCHLVSPQNQSIKEALLSSSMHQPSVQLFFRPSCMNDFVMK